nr:enoyl-[acyl-carrier-protein] reductase [NADH], chloroplastic-like [Tanacetum cinerariifolium]
MPLNHVRKSAADHGGSGGGSDDRRKRGVLGQGRGENLIENGLQATKPLIDTSMYGYLAAILASSYSFISLHKHFVPIMNLGGVGI